ncbi:MAG: GTP pyrophosphokinase family protein, partial [Corynebacterium kroppenstedtii]|nr:GTP pyrophosphokinase family protein [Corynebacterium kroppenstedtii]
NTGSDPRIDRAFTLAAGLIELADQQFDQIASIANQTPRATDSSDDASLSPEILPGVLTVILGPLFPRSKSEYYRYAYAMLAAHGITDVGGLRELLSDDLAEAVRSVMHPDFPPGQVRMVDDVLLARYGRDHIKKTVDIGDHGETRSGRLGNRWKKLLDAGLGAASKS